MVGTMDTGEQEQAGGRPAVISENQTDEQRRQARQADRIRDMERQMRGVIAFTRGPRD